MKHLVLIFSIPLLLFLTDAGAAPVIFIVRHAEKASSGDKDPDLSVQGQKRADALAHILQDSQITSVFVTEFKRTQETGAPTATAAHVTPTVLPANDIGALVEKLHALKGNALVVGLATLFPTCSRRLASRRQLVFLMTITPKFLSYWLATRRSCSDCIIHFD